MYYKIILLDYIEIRCQYNFLSADIVCIIASERQLNNHPFYI